MPGEPILVVDDAPINLKLTRILLQQQGYEVRTATCAEEALEVLESFRPRLVLADIQMPGVDGLEMTRRIKQDPRHRDVLVVALTALAMEGDEALAIAAGCDGYITKPIDTRGLVERIRAFLQQEPAAGRRATCFPPPTSKTCADGSWTRRGNRSLFGWSNWMGVSTLRRRSRLLTSGWERRGCWDFPASAVWRKQRKRFCARNRWTLPNFGRS